MAGAIVIVGPEESGIESGMVTPSIPLSGSIKQGSLACVEVLGRSVLGRTVEELAGAGLDSICVFAKGAFTSAVIGEEKVEFHSTVDVWQDVTKKLSSLKEDGVEVILVVRLGAYMEFDAGEFIQFHSAAGEAVTRAYDDQGALDLWVISSRRMPDESPALDFLWKTKAAYYPVRGYVNRLENPRDIRRLIGDGLASRCQFRPMGFEIRPGVWMAQGAQVDKGARIVAPAFIGRGAKIADQCLVTRASNIESNSYIDYGTVVENSSVLSNTYVGIGLELSHSIVDGNRLLNLEHEVMLRIADPVVLRAVRESKDRGESGRRMLLGFERGDAATSSVSKS